MHENLETPKNVGEGRFPPVLTAIERVAKTAKLCDASIFPRPGISSEAAAPMCLCTARLSTRGIMVLSAAHSASPKSFARPVQTSTCDSVKDSPDASVLVGEAMRLRRMQRARGDVC